MSIKLIYSLALVFAINCYGSDSGDKKFEEQLEKYSRIEYALSHRDFTSYDASKHWETLKQAELLIAELPNGDLRKYLQSLYDMNKNIYDTYKNMYEEIQRIEERCQAEKDLVKQEAQRFQGHSHTK